VDGFRVSSLRQFRVQNRLSPAPEATIIYWRKGNAVEASVARVTMRDHSYKPD
jgi:hypothetical protein